MRFPLLGGFSLASPCPKKKNILGSGEGWGSLQSPNPSPSCAIQTCWLWLLCPKSSMLRGAQARQGAGKQDTGRWKTIGKTPNPFPEQGKGPRSLLLPQCSTFGV